MTIKLSLDLQKCNGNGLCALESPALFALDEDTGRGVLLAERLDNDSREDAVAAVHICPSQAISMEDE